MKGHTAGKWTAAIHGGGWYVAAEAHKHGVVADAIRVEADAHLLASAPLLLEALIEAREELVGCYERMGIMPSASEELARIDTAIAATRSEK